MATADTLATCGIAAWSYLDVPRAELPALRKQPGEFQGGRAPATAVKLADEHGVLAMVAVLRAIESAGWRERSFQEWGVIAAPRFMARLQTAAVLEKLCRIGVRGVSPLAVPHTMLSAVSGTLSVALGAQGLNIGVGGAPSQLRDALLIGLTMTQAGIVPGIWVVMTEYSVEPTPDGKGDSPTPTSGRAVALACVAPDHAEARHVLRLKRTEGDGAEAALSDTASLGEYLAAAHATTSSVSAIRPPRELDAWSTDLGGGLCAVLEPLAPSVMLPTATRRAA